MEIKIDESAFDKRQYALTVEIVKAIKTVLKKNKKLDDDDIYDLTEGTSFAVCALLDGSQDMQIEGKPLLSQLTFYDNEETDEILISDRGSWLHEYVHSILDDIFEEEDEFEEEDLESFDIRFLKKGKECERSVVQSVMFEWKYDHILSNLKMILAILNQIEEKDLILNKSLKECDYQFLDFDSIMIEGAFNYMINKNDEEFRMKFLETEQDYSIKDLTMFIYEKVRIAQNG